MSVYVPAIVPTNNTPHRAARRHAMPRQLFTLLVNIGVLDHQEAGGVRDGSHPLSDLPSNLERLEFGVDVVYDKNCARVAEVIESAQISVPQLTRLKFIWVFFGFMVTAKFFRSVVRNPAVFEHVRELTFERQGLALEDFKAFAFMLGVLPNLEYLFISDCRITGSDMATVIKGLKTSACAGKLRELYDEGAELLGGAIGRDSLPSLLGMCTSSRINLTSLNLRSVGMGDTGLTFLAEVIRRGALVDCLNLDTNDNGTENIVPLADALRDGNLKNLTTFNFGMSKLDGEAAAVLVRALLEHCPVLTDLTLEDIGLESRQAITEVLDTYELDRELTVELVPPRELSLEEMLQKALWEDI